MVDKLPQNLDEVQNFKLVDQKYYIKNHKLGKGNYAETWLAVMKDDSKKVLACKMIQKQDIITKLKHSKNPEARKEYIINSLKNEVQLWKTLEHPNIVKFFDFSETPNNIYFFLEYCAGGDLEKLLKQKGALPEAEAFELFVEIASGIALLYNKKVFHRDIKPENILMHEGHAKIADFGFAKLIAEDDVETKALGTAVGTPYYMAPQILGGEEYSIKCDVWSLGVMFYQMLTAMLPWNENNSIVDLYNKIKKDKVVFPKNLKICQGLKDCICKMLTVDEAHRYNVLEVEEHLTKIGKANFGK